MIWALSKHQFLKNHFQILRKLLQTEIKVSPSILIFFLIVRPYQQIFDDTYTHTTFCHKKTHFLWSSHSISTYPTGKYFPIEICLSSKSIIDFVTHILPSFSQASGFSLTSTLILSACSFVPNHFCPAI